MARSWDARVRGASQKATTPTGADGVRTDDAQPDTASVEAAPLDSTAAVTDAALQADAARAPQSPGSSVAVQEAPGRTALAAGSPQPEPEAPLQAQTKPRTLRSFAERAAIVESQTEQPASVAAPNPPPPQGAIELVGAGLVLAVNALDVPVIVVDRTTGRIEFASQRWIDRFGSRPTWARHAPDTGTGGEAPLPPPGQSWQRTRSLVFADGREDLAELMMLGTTDALGHEVVTIVALDRTGTGAAITDRAEVISIVDGALSDQPPGSVAVLYVDLDRFKVVHDLVGNVEALRLLDLVSRRIAGVVRPNDMMFRLPSDEFVVIATDLDHPAIAEELAERVRSCVATLSDVGHDLALTASVGVALADDNQSGDALLSASETAVYLAKGRGRNRVAVHDEELRTRSQRLLVVERQLRKAIEQRDVRFAYQPVVDLPTGEVIGAEALLRLGGDIGLSAVEVVAAAEHSGLMGTLGSLVFQGVEEQLGAVLRSDDPRMVMVNLSATQLADDGLLETLGQIVEDDSIPNGRFAVEVPEIVIREHHDAFQQLCHMLQPKFQLGVDGFGTNVASLDVLKGLPIDYVKLHRSLTTALGSDRESREQLAEMIATATERCIGVIALGVERLDQARILVDLGCSKAQGFLYAGAVNADDLVELIDRRFEPIVPTESVG